MKIISIVGARPQFVKLAAIHRAIQNHSFKYIYHIIIHTGQHYDSNMNDIFFKQLEIPKPDFNLNINNLSHGAMTGQMLEGIEKILFDHRPDFVFVYGDTNSTLAGALAAKKLHIKIAHIEAGLRSFNMNMPEEINRILTDRISDHLFCPNMTSVKNLQEENYRSFNLNYYYSGDIMYDSVLHYSDKSVKPDFNIPDKYILATIHRAEVINSIVVRNHILSALDHISSQLPVIMPIHPGFKNKIDDFIHIYNNIQFVDPVGYLQMIWLIQNCEIVMTDSGGLQKESYFLNKTCVVLRNETEWPELVDRGYNILSGTMQKSILPSVKEALNLQPKTFREFYGDGHAGEFIINRILDTI